MIQIIDNSLSYYIKTINRFPLLTKTQEKEIAIKSYNGNKKAKNTLILSNLRFVIKVAKRYINHYLPFIDLISEGNLGLIRAAETFNPYKGFTFISYAVHWIKQSILKAIAEKAQILKIPLKWNNKISQVKKQIANKTSENLDNIEVKKISKDINMKENDVTKLLNCSQKSISFDTLLTVDPAKVLTSKANINTKSPENSFTSKALKTDVKQLLNNLKPIEKQVIESRFGFNDSPPKTLAEIGKELNVTKERIRQIEKKALIALKKEMQMFNMISYLA